MMASLLRWFRPRRGAGLNRADGRKKTTCQLHLEALEDRIVPSAGWAIDAAAPINTASSTSNWGVALDGQSNSYITGQFIGSTSFGATNLNSVTGSVDAYVAKCGPSGSVLWAMSLGGAGKDAAFRVAADASGAYVVGYFSGTATFGTTTLTSIGSQDAFIAKLDATSGNVSWVQQFGSAGQVDAAWGVAVDASGNVYATGFFLGTASFGKTSLGSPVTLTSAGGQDAFVTKLDSAGNTVWATDMGGSADDEALAAAVDGSGNVYATGSFHGTASFGAFSLTSNTTTGGTNAFVTRLDPVSGTPQWATSIGGDSTSGSGIATDASGGVYVTGGGFVDKLDATNGSLTWVDGGPGGFAIALDGVGNVCTTGTFGGPSNFDPHGTFIMTPGAFQDAYVSMLDPNGNFLAAWQTKATATDHNFGRGIAADSAGDIWCSGNFDVTTAFPSGQTLSPAVPGNAEWHTYLMRLNAPHGAVLGTLYADLNNNGVRDSEPPLVGWKVDAYLTSNGAFVASATTDLHGNYQIGNLPPATYTIRPELPTGWTTSAQPNNDQVTVGSGFALNNNFGEYTPTTVTTYTNSKATSISSAGRFGSSTAQSTLSVSDSYSLLDVDVKVNISFPTDASLSVYLIGPDGTKVPLALGNGGLGANFTNTTFADEAPISISNGSAPFSGSYQPLGPLSALQGTSVKGTWTLQVANTSKSTGKINSWSLIATHTTAGYPLLAAPPQIGSFTASPNPVTAGVPFTLTAANVSDPSPGGTITRVAFYQDTNGDGILDSGDTLLGYGTQTSPGTWTFSFTFSTSGTYTLFAQAVDNYGVLSNPLALNLTVT